MFWYELDICPINDSVKEYYKHKEYENENAGFDLYTSENKSIYEAVEFIPFGIKVVMRKVFETGNSEICHYWLLPRSSIYKSGLIMANSVGVIDASYRGEVKAPVWSMTGTSKVNEGDRLFQIVAPDMGWIRRVNVVESLPETSRGEGGFGSTGK
jgi:dUTP pyrophosphatase